MIAASNLNRFLAAQDRTYATALQEIKRGRKTTHWMWYIFPQIQGLGLSETAKLYAIQDGEEAAAYLQHPVLGKRLVEISEALLQLPGNNAYAIFGSPDDMKLKSCMTLFETLPDAPPVFRQVLEKFYNGRKDERTLAILNRNN